MEEFSYRQSPREFLLSRNTEATPPRLNDSYRKCSYGSALQKENIALAELKKEHSKAMNTIEILKLEKSNLETALKFSKDFRKNKFPEGTSFSASSFRTPVKENFKLDYPAEIDRKTIELRHEIEEYKRLLANNFVHIENLKKETNFYREKLQDNENLTSNNLMLQDELKTTTQELQTLDRRVSELEEEKQYLLDKLSRFNHHNNSRPQGLDKYIDHIYNLVNTFSSNHFVNYHFYECFPENQSIDLLIEENDTNQLLLQTFKFLTNILVSFNSTGPQNMMTNVLSSESSDHKMQQNTSYSLAHQQTSRSKQGQPTSIHYKVDKNSSVLPEIDPQSRFSPSLMSVSEPHRTHPGTMISNSPPKINLNDVSKNGNISRAGYVHPSFGETESQLQNATVRPQSLNQTQTSRRESYPLNTKTASTSKAISNRVNTELNSSKRNISQTMSFSKNVSAVSSPKSQARIPTRHVLNIKPTEIGRSPRKSNDSVRNKSRDRLEASLEMSSERLNEINKYNQELAEKEFRLREVERELAEKERLLRYKDYEIKGKRPSDVRTAGFGFRGTEQDLVNASEGKLSHRNLDQKSILSQKPNPVNTSYNARDKANLSRNQSLRQDTREVLAPKSNKKENPSNSILKSRIIPTITSLHDFDGSPKAGTSPFSKQDVTKKAASAFLSSFPNVEYDHVIENDRSSRSPLANRQAQSSSSIKEINNGGGYHEGENRLSFRDAYINTQQADHSQQLKSGHDSNMKANEDYNSNMHFDNQPLQNSNDDYSSQKYQGDETRKRITFDMQTMDYIEEYPSHNENNSSPESIRRRERNINKKTKGNEYSTFRVSFGKTQSKEFRSGSPPPEPKDSLYVFDIPKRKRVTHSEQTYDIVKGNEIRYTLNSRGSKYDAKNENAPKSISCSEVQSPCSEKKRSSSFVTCAQRLDTL